MDQLFSVKMSDLIVKVKEKRDTTRNAGINISVTLSAFFPMEEKIVKSMHGCFSWSGVCRQDQNLLFGEG